MKEIAFIFGLMFLFVGFVAIVTFGLPEIEVKYPKAVAGTPLPSTITKFSDNGTDCYIYYSDYIMMGQTSRIGGISCVKD